MDISHTLVRSARRTLQLEISRTGEVVIRAPKRMSEERILKFVQEKEKWITKNVLKIHEKKAVLKKNDDEFLFLGEKIKVFIQTQKPPLALVGDYFFMREDCWEEKEKYFEKFCRTFLRKKAETIIPEMTEKIGKIHNRISINGAKTRWGSCSGKRNINFSWRLTMAPEEVIRYVFAHEVAHLQEMNHSPAFWKTVEKIFPEYTEHKQWLKDHGHALHNDER